MSGRRRGMLMITTLYVLGALLFFLVLFLQAQGSLQQSAHIHSDRMLALSAAEAGINEGFSRLNHDAAFAAGFEATLGNGAEYSVRFVSNVGGDEVIHDADGFEVPVGLALIVSEGRFGLARVRQGSLVKPQGGYLKGGLFIYDWWTN